MHARCGLAKILKIRPGKSCANIVRGELWLRAPAVHGRRLVEVAEESGGELGSKRCSMRALGLA